MNNRTVETGTIRMNVIEHGEGPLVLLCHGFPETSYAWRHQIPALAAAFDYALQEISMKGIFAEFYLRYFPVSFY